MENTASLDLRFCNRSHSIHSNTVHFKKLDIEFHKHGPECPFVVEGEEIEFSFRLKNNTDMEFHNVEFIDRLERGLEFVEGSLKINGQPVHCHGHHGCHGHDHGHGHHNVVRHRIHCLRPHEELRISFLAKVL